MNKDRERLLIIIIVFVVDTNGTLARARKRIQRYLNQNICTSLLLAQDESTRDWIRSPEP